MSGTVNAAQSEFLSAMSHELRTPLNAILGFAQLLESDSPAPTTGQRESIQHILGAGWYLLKLINEILDLARIESGRLPLTFEVVSIGDVVRECVDAVEERGKKRRIDIVFARRLESPLLVRADRGRLAQMLTNVLLNAIKYGESGKSVDVTCEPDVECGVRIAVKTAGMGLTPQKLAVLFQPFERVEHESGAEDGTAVGLYLSHRLAELMHARIGAQRCDGESTEFWIEFPVVHPADVQPEHVETPAPTTLETLAAPVRTVLYVEDNHANMSLVEQLIGRRSDLRLLTAADGVLGVELARTEIPDVILLDINIPGINGEEVLVRLRNDPTTTHIPILAVSANANPREIQHALHLGFMRYITKPIRMTEFFEALDVALDVSKVRTSVVPGSTSW